MSANAQIDAFVAVNQFFLWLVSTIIAAVVAAFVWPPLIIVVLTMSAYAAYRILRARRIQSVADQISHLRGLIAIDEIRKNYLFDPEGTRAELRELEDRLLKKYGKVVPRRQ